MFKVNELIRVTGAKAHRRKDALVKGISIDSRTLKPKDVFVAIKGGNFDGHDFIDEAVKKGASCIVVSCRLQAAGSKLKLPVLQVKDTTKALGDIAGYHRSKFNIPVIAITGSNGKTTTKEMVARVLSGKGKVLSNPGTKNNHIGLPLTLLNLDSSYDFVVVELGTNHFGEIGYLAKIASPDIGVITNVGPSHLEYFKSLRGVFSEKYSLINNLNGRGLAILNADDTFLRKKIMQVSRNPTVFSFGINNKSDFRAQKIKAIDGRIEFTAGNIQFALNTLGCHNIYNALVAIALGRIFGMDYRSIWRRLAGISFLRNRLSLVKVNRIKFIDDSYNSNPNSLKQALAALSNHPAKGRKIFVMGDMLELGRQKVLFHRRAGHEVAKCCDVFVTVGKLSKFAAEIARLCGLRGKNIFICESSGEARDILFNKVCVRPDDLVLVKGSRSMKMEEVLKI